MKKENKKNYRTGKIFSLRGLLSADTFEDINQVTIPLDNFAKQLFFNYIRKIDSLKSYRFI